MRLTLVGAVYITFVLVARSFDFEVQRAVLFLAAPRC